jgi:hypothetical protein
VAADPVRARLRYFAVSVVIASVPVALMVLASQTGREGRQTEPLWQVVGYGLTQWYPWVLVAPAIDWLVRRSRSRTWRHRARIIAGHLALFAIFAVVHGSVRIAAAAYLHPEEAGSAAGGLLDDWIPDALLYGVLTGGFAIAESRRRQTEIAEGLRAEVAEARLDALRQQLNPHFLFNALNHIAARLRSREIEPALAMLLSLSDLLRDVLRERAQLIPLRDEVRMIERYLEIERARFGDRLHAEITFDPRALDALVPSFLLQPLVENAMRHGVSAADGRCTLSVTVRPRGERLSIEVRDGGPGLSAVPAAATGIGLANTRQRLTYLYADDHAFELRTLDGGGLLVSVDLPFRRS